MKRASKFVFCHCRVDAPAEPHHLEQDAQGGGHVVLQDLPLHEDRESARRGARGDQPHGARGIRVRDLSEGYAVKRLPAHPQV